MARCPVVRPESVRLPLSGDDYIDVKKRLNTGEYRRVIFSQYKDSGAVDMEQMGVSKILGYVLGWSFVNLDGSPLPFTRDALLSIDPDSFREVLEAVEAHEDAQDQVRSEEKNAQRGEIPSPAISPSVVG